ELLYDYNDVRKNNFFRTKCTDVKHLSVKSNMLYDSNNKLESIILVIADNTETITSNNKLAEFELLFDSMSEFAGIGLGRYNMVRDRFEVSDQWCANLCKTKQEISTFAQTYSNIYADDLALIASNFRAIRDGQIDNFCSEVRVHDGEKDKWLKYHYKISRRNHNASNEMELVGLNIDITSQKNTENSLIEAKTKAEESDRLKSAFLANMSHEIRTPLNAIVGFSDILVDTSDQEEKMQYVSIIKQNNELLLQLISDILDISKIESGIISITPGKFDVNVMCEEIVRSNSIKAPAGVELIFDRHKEPCIICSDKNKLIHILTNLIGNGMKFTKKGTIRLGYLIDESSVSFYVKDSGIGIDKEHLYSIFDRFVKLDSFVQGSGLGLSICRSLTDKLHGRIWAESEQGKGSCFWVSLPYNYEYE
ncbi:MAG: ATP-binding protein, partial [Rikenellaceae bacterium]